MRGSCRNSPLDEKKFNLALPVLSLVVWDRDVLAGASGPISDHEAKNYTWEGNSELGGAESLRSPGHAMPALDGLPVGFFPMNVLRPLFVRSLLVRDETNS